MSGSLSLFAEHCAIILKRRVCTVHSARALNVAISPYRTSKLFLSTPYQQIVCDWDYSFLLILFLFLLLLIGVDLLYWCSIYCSIFCLSLALSACWSDIYTGQYADSPCQNKDTKRDLLDDQKGKWRLQLFHEFVYYSFGATYYVGLGSQKIYP